MSVNPRIHIVAPPFGGHLHPQLALANHIRQATGLSPKIVSTPGAAGAVRLSGLDFTAVLATRESTIQGIANTPRRVGSNPRRLFSQLRDNISMMDQLVEELSSVWRTERPTLVIADFAVPVAGLLAERMGISWWTAIRAPSVIDTPDGVPCYFGGLQPRADWLGRLRDRCGRLIIRSFKQIAFRMHRDSLSRLGITTVYRDDGYERIYSSRRILIQGIREFEFPCRWPPSAVFVGPMTASPPFPHVAPSFVQGQPHVLVSLGTHVRWAQDSAFALVRKVADRMPDVQFHFSRGEARLNHHGERNNLTEISYLPYDQYMNRYAVSMNHAGSGVMYSSLRQGVPILAWPQDFDQFDNTARLLFHGLGLRCRSNIGAVEAGLRRLLADSPIRERCEKMGRAIRHFPTQEILTRLLSAE